MKSVNYLFIIISFLLISCSKDDNPVKPEEKQEYVDFIGAPGTLRTYLERQFVFDMVTDKPVSLVPIEYRSQLEITEAQIDSGYVKISNLTENTSALNSEEKLILNLPASEERYFSTSSGSEDYYPLTHIEYIKEGEPYGGAFTYYSKMYFKRSNNGIDYIQFFNQDKEFEETVYFKNNLIKGDSWTRIKRVDRTTGDIIYQEDVNVIGIEEV